MDADTITFNPLPRKAASSKRPRPTDQGGGARPAPLVRRLPGATATVRAFDEVSLAGSHRVGIVGLPGTGKSTACLALLAALRFHFPVVTVCSGSENDNPFYTKFLPRIFVHPKCTRKRLKMFINRQRLAVANRSPLLDGLLVLDDVFEHPDTLNNDALRILYKQGRHLHASVWCMQQVALDLKPWARSTTSAVILFHTPSIRERKLLYENYGSIFPDFATFNALYSRITTEKYTAMVVLLNRGETDILRSVFWYRPRPVNPDGLRIGHPVIWQHAAMRTDESRVNQVTLLSCHSGDDR